MNLVVALTGASGALATRLLLEASPWPVTLVASRWGRRVYERECGDFAALQALAARTWEPDDLEAPIASGSVPTAGMVILPCSCNTLAQIAAGIGDNLITRAAHCHLKERRGLVLCVREAPWTTIDLANAQRAAGAGAFIMPLCPPYYMAGAGAPEELPLKQLLGEYARRVLALLGHPLDKTWEDRR